MACFSINNVVVAGMSACVPSASEDNQDNSFLSKEDKQKFIETTGVERRRIAGAGVCTSDLCLEAAKKLLAEIEWRPEDIDVLIFVSQSPDYLMPVTSATLQERLGIGTQCMAFDIPLGCSGFVYGASVLAGMLRSTGLKKGLLLAGDTCSKMVSQKDKSTGPLFGDAGTATAFSYSEGAPPMHFSMGTDGAGYQAIIIPDGGYRHRVSQDSLVEKEFGEGIVRSKCHVALDGMDVFSFGITQAPKTVNELLNAFSIDREIVDYYVFHQANLMMNKMVAKKLKIPESKVPYSLKNFGNTSSATIPLTVITELKSKMTMPVNLVFCGFGVGLSWGTMYLEQSVFHCCELIEL